VLLSIPKGKIRTDNTGKVERKGPIANAVLLGLTLTFVKEKRKSRLRGPGRDATLSEQKANLQRTESEDIHLSKRAQGRE